MRIHERQKDVDGALRPGLPCAFLAPTADQADKYPHNIKTYNLCRIRRIGLERWIEEEAGQIRRNYFTCRFKMGKGQAE